MYAVKVHLYTLYVHMHTVHLYTIPVHMRILHLHLYTVPVHLDTCTLYMYTYRDVHLHSVRTCTPVACFLKSKHVTNSMSA